MINRMIKLLSMVLVLSVSDLVFSATDSAESNTIGVNPSIVVFKSISVTSGSTTATVEVKNKGSSNRFINGVSLSGDHADQFQITMNNCNGVSIAAGGGCSVVITFTPTARGYKQALLDVDSDSPDTPLLQVFLTNREDDNSQSSRRLPPVLYSLDIPEQMLVGQTYELKWSILGYHEDYLSSVVMFNCNGITDGSCGANYGDSTRIFSKVGVTNGKVVTNWRNGDIYAKEFMFKATFTPQPENFTEAMDIVVRFYRLNTDDKLAGGGGLSLIIPGNLSNEYYDKQGRRIKKRIVLQ